MDEQIKPGHFGRWVVQRGAFIGLRTRSKIARAADIGYPHFCRCVRFSRRIQSLHGPAMSRLAAALKTTTEMLVLGWQTTPPCKAPIIEPDSTTKQPTVAEAAANSKERIRHVIA